MAGKSVQNAYLNTQISTASKEQLLLMLFDGALKFAHQALQSLESRNIENLAVFSIKVQNIMTELMGALDEELISEALYTNLMSLYHFVHKRMVHGNIERNPGYIKESIQVLEQLRGVWKSAVDQALEENGGKMPDFDLIKAQAVASKERMNTEANKIQDGAKRAPSIPARQALPNLPNNLKGPVRISPAAGQSTSQQLPNGGIAQPQRPAQPAQRPATQAQPQPAPQATPAPEAGKPGFVRPKINLGKKAGQ